MIDFDRDAAIQAYKDGATVCAVAERFGVGRMVIIREIAARGLKGIRRPSRKGADFDRDAAVSDYLDGMTLHRIAMKHGVSHATIDRELCKRGVRRERAKREAKVTGRKVKTHCKHGHPMEAWNLYVDRKGNRSCLSCRKLRVPVTAPKHFAEWGMA